MEKLTAEVWLVNPHEVREYWRYHLAHDMAGAGWFKVTEQVVHFSPPLPEEVIPATITALKAKQQEILAKAQSAANVIGKTIENLLAIGHSAPTSVLETPEADLEWP